jgi:hypothetical protein
MTRLERAVRSALLPEDTWSRHDAAARILGTPERVLDVGGVRCLLALFLPGSSVTTVNVERPADVLFDGARLPFSDLSFDSVTSLDVLEHVPPGARQAHVAELARVAATTVVLSCPVGTDEHVTAEQDLARWYREATGRSHRFLDEHLANGLPTERELRDLANGTGLTVELVYAGDLRARRARSREAALSSTPARWSNRAFLVMKRASGVERCEAQPSAKPVTPAAAGTLPRT